MKKRTILISLFAVFLAGCASGTNGRQFVSELDDGYKLTEKSAEEAGPSLSQGENMMIGAGVSGAASAALPASLGLGAFGAATGGIALVAVGIAPLAACSLTKCYAHEPFGKILMSGNVLRGKVHYRNFNMGIHGSKNNPSIPEWKLPIKYRVFKNPELAAAVVFQQPNEWTDVAEWSDYPLFEESLGLQGGDLVDVYYPHNPNLEREAIAKKLIYSGTIVRIVCKYDDDDCFDKYARNDDNFILGRWKTLEEYKAEYTTTGGFPNTETPTTATSE